jgi:hypothetical protein
MVGPHKEQNNTLECERAVTQLGWQNYEKLAINQQNGTFTVFYGQKLLRNATEIYIQESSTITAFVMFG